MSKITSGWYKIYRPKSIDKYIFQNEEDKRIFLNYIKNQDIPDLLFSGHRGTGKTTLGLILKNELNIEDIDCLILNASDENSVDDVRNQIKPFINQLSVGKFKLVFFDEADALTIQAQEALKSMMEDEFKNARFILTCNKPHKIIPELRSRCTEYKFNSLNRLSMKEMGLEILIENGLSIDFNDSDNINELLDEHLKLSYPDQRKFINSLEKYFDGKILHSPSVNDDDIESLVELLVHIENKDWKSARTKIYSSFTNEDIDNTYKFLDSNLHEISRFDNDLLPKGYIILAYYAFMNESVAVPELNLTACIIKLCDLGS